MNWHTLPHWLPELLLTVVVLFTIQLYVRMYKDEQTRKKLKARETAINEMPLEDAMTQLRTALTDAGVFETSRSSGGPQSHLELPPCVEALFDAYATVRPRGTAFEISTELVEKRAGLVRIGVCRPASAKAAGRPLGALIEEPLTIFVEPPNEKVYFMDTADCEGPTMKNRWDVRRNYPSIAHWLLICSGILETPGGDAAARS
jgi:hypothetical protein